MENLIFEMTLYRLQLDLLHKPHNAPAPYPTMHYFVI